ncbi:MAG: hypothetical protein JO024_07605 [Candidatus Eremiobacteraeota bacterium]|nr:hypothetical protein [Candidatus Eremiobacteraeota bacterium]MBV9736529.1 hypothetical protein [Candidatus Eremiobacteraeota bacterium]
MRVLHGSLDVSVRGNAAYLQARRYLCRDPIERTIFSSLEHGPRHIHLRLNSSNDDSYDPNTRTIYWDPCSALRTTGGGRQSPALGLGHEADHATVSAAIRDADIVRRIPAYDNLEERRVILGSEQHAARTLHEAVRHDHRGSCYRVATPTSR